MNQKSASSTAVLLLVLALFTGPASAVSTYTEYWDGVPFLEYSDPLARFVSLPISDPDGDGIGDLPNLPYLEGEEVIGSLDHITDAEIEAQVQRLGWSRDFIIAQVDLVLSGDPQYLDERAGFANLVSQGLFTAGVNLVTGTPADITLWCGPLGSPTKLTWVVGVPTTVDCNGDLVEDVAVAPEVTNVSFSGTSVNSINVLFGAQGINALLSGRYVLGGGYGNNNGGVYTAVGLKTFTVDFSVSGLATTTYSGHANIQAQVGSFSGGDRFYYSYGTLTRGKSAALVLTSSKTSYGINYTFKNRGSNDWDVTVSVSSTSGVYAEGYLELTGGRTLQLQGFTLPSTLTLGYTRRSTVAGTKYDIRVSGSSSIVNTEIKGSLFNGGSPEITFQFVGLPTVNFLTLDLGDESRQIASFDLTKGSASPTGYYRTILVNGQVQKFLLDGTVKDANRVNIVMGGSDPWDSDGDPFVELGLNAQTSNGSIDIKAKENWLKQYRGKMSVNCWTCSPKRYNHELGPSPTCTINCSGTLNEGTVFENDSTFFNGWFWAISPPQLGANWCFRSQDGVCP